MRKLSLVLILTSLLVWIGCGSDDEDDTPTGPTDNRVRVQAYITSNAPSITNINDPLWDSVPPGHIDYFHQGSNIKSNLCGSKHC